MRTSHHLRSGSLSNEWNKHPLQMCVSMCKHIVSLLICNIFELSNCLIRLFSNWYATLCSHIFALFTNIPQSFYSWNQYTINQCICFDILTDIKNDIYCHKIDLLRCLTEADIKPSLNRTQKLLSYFTINDFILLSVFAFKAYIWFRQAWTGILHLVLTWVKTLL